VGEIKTEYSYDELEIARAEAIGMLRDADGWMLTICKEMNNLEKDIQAMSSISPGNTQAILMCCASENVSHFLRQLTQKKE
jgi:hypothetical protein